MADQEFSLSEINCGFVENSLGIFELGQEICNFPTAISSKIRHQMSGASLAAVYAGAIINLETWEWCDITLARPDTNTH